MKVAIVYDRVNKYGGAERVLEILHEIWPEAPLYTAFYNPKKARWARVLKVIPSFLNKVPFASLHHELYAWATPFAFEQFNFDKFDVVISVTSADAKNIVTKPNTCHICYLLTPTRYLWTDQENHIKNPSIGFFSFLSPFFLKLLSPYLKKTDFIASRKPDYLVAISNVVSERSKMYYKRKPDAIIYPPCDVEKFKPTLITKSKWKKLFKKQNFPGNDFFLVVSRLVSYKRIDSLIDCFKSRREKLIIIGSGHQLSILNRYKYKNIEIINEHLTDNKLLYYYNLCRAYIFAGSEDFGISACEAQACGKPVIAYADSGIAEIVKEGETGILFRYQTNKSIDDAIKRFRRSKFSSDTIRKNALRFASVRFEKEIKAFVEKKYQEFKFQYK